MYIKLTDVMFQTLSFLYATGVKGSTICNHMWDNKSALNYKMAKLKGSHINPKDGLSECLIV